MGIDTRQVKDRRALRFGSLADLRAEVARIGAADRAGTLRRTGNWTAGQSFNHVAAWMNYAFDGTPPPRPPWFVRAMGPFVKRRFLHKGMPAGFRLGGVEGGTHATQAVSTEEGERAINSAIDRLERGTPPDRHQIFGRMTHRDWIDLNLRHAELHLSFLWPQTPQT